MSSVLFTPLDVGAIQIKNRVVMSALTRGRADKEGVPSKIMVDYYAQRASAGLILSEATGISREGLGWAYAPGIWSDAQVAAWKEVVDAVHAKGGKMVLQLWHMGRAVHSSITGTQPVSASATKTTKALHTYDGKKEPEEARPLTKDDIKRIIQDHVHGAKNAIKAGFDLVEVQGGNGYLLDQFLRSSSNLRTDEYGGSIENRTRFLDEVVAAVVEAVGADRTGVRISPNGEIMGVVDDDPVKLFTYVAETLQKHKIAFLDMRESSKESTFGATDQPQVHEQVRKVFKQVLILCQDYNKEKATEAIEKGTCDALAFGRFYLANPDLVERFKNNAPLAHPDMSKVYTNGADGYNDYPAFKQS